MDIGDAVIALKAGRRVRREYWPARVSVSYQKGYPDGIAINANTAESTGIPEGTVCRFVPYLMMRMSDGAFTPWTISPSDVLAEDWEVL